MTIHYNFIVKLISVMLISVFMWKYQGVALEREQLISENKAKVKEVNEYNANVKRQISESVKKYKDGIYDGVATGFGGDIAVTVNINNDIITEIDVIEHKSEDPIYYEQAVGVVDDIIASNSVSVDTVSGATFSSRGIISAVEDALRKAEK